MFWSTAAFLGSSHPRGLLATKKQAVKLTASQVEIGFDILKARDVGVVAGSPPSTATPPEAHPEPNSANNSVATEKGDDDRRRKPYRLMVKRRLLKRYGEELSTDGPTRKHQLEELYRDVEAGYFSLGAKLREEEESRSRKSL